MTGAYCRVIRRLLCFLSVFVPPTTNDLTTLMAAAKWNALPPFHHGNILRVWECDEARESAMPPMSDDLKSIISKYIKAWGRMSRVYAFISVLLRGSLIIASSLVAARLGTGKFLGETTLAAFSIYVAAGTGIEAWLKPREKWKGFMTDCENAEDLLVRLEKCRYFRFEESRRFSRGISENCRYSSREKRFLASRLSRISVSPTATSAIVLR
jgi:hypothetical protein